MANAYRQQMQNQDNGGAAGPQTDKEEYPSRKFLNEGDEMVGVIVSQSGWLPGTNGTFRIMSMDKGGDKFSFLIGSEGQKDALANALDAAGLSETQPGDMLRLKWVDTKKTSNGFKFRLFDAKVARPE